MSTEDFLIDVESVDIKDKPLVHTMGGLNHPFVLIEAGTSPNMADGAVRVVFGGADEEFTEELLRIALDHLEETR